MEKYNVIIVGGGPGGYTAALYAARAGLSTMVIEMLSAGGQMATTSLVENYPGFDEGIDGFELGGKMQKGAENFGAVTEFGEVVSLDLRSVPKKVVTTDAEYEADAVIIATGANPRKLGVEGEEALYGRGIAYCATCDGMFYKGKTVAVIGGGDTAAEDALYLSKLCHKVYIVHRRDKMRAAQSSVKKLRALENVEFVLNANVAGFEYDKKLTKVKLRDANDGHGFEIDCDGVFVAVGRIPNTDIVKGQLDIDESGYILAGEDTKTSLDGVFAVGDVRRKPLRQIITAASDGANASKAALEYIEGLE